MKRNFIFSLFILTILMGCSNDETYNKAIQKGLDYLASEEFQKAEGSFESALDEKKDDQKATALLEQTIHYQAALEALDEEDLDNAKEKAGKVISIDNGSSALIKKSEEITMSVEELEKELTEVTEEYEAASSFFDAKEYKKATEIVDNILRNDLEEMIFKSIKQKVVKLEKDIDSALDAEKKAEEDRVAKEKEEQEKAKQAKIKEENNEKAINLKLSLEKMRELAKQYVNDWNGYDNNLDEEFWDDEEVWRYYIFQDGPTQHIVGVGVHSETGEVKGDYGGID